MSYDMKYIPSRGVVYIVSNTFLHERNIFKIGHCKNLEDRLEEYNKHRHSQEFHYYIVSIFYADNAKDIVHYVQRTLKENRDEDDYFKCDIKDIIDVIKTKLSEQQPEEVTLDDLMFDI